MMKFAFILTACIAFSACRTTQPVREVYIESHNIDTIILHDSTHILTAERWKGDTLYHDSIVYVYKIIQHQRFRDSVKIDTINLAHHDTPQNIKKSTTFEKVCKWLSIVIGLLTALVVAVWLLLKRI